MRHEESSSDQEGKLQIYHHWKIVVLRRCLVCSHREIVTAHAKWIEAHKRGQDANKERNLQLGSPKNLHQCLGQAFTIWFLVVTHWNGQSRFLQSLAY